MSLSNDYAPIKQIGNGVTVDFSGTWKVLVASYIRVYKQNIATGVKTLMALGTDYTLVFTDAGFTVTYAVAPTSAEYALISRETGADQLVGYKTSKGFDGSAIEASLDKLTAIVQDHSEQLSRALASPLGATVLDIELPLPSAGKGLRWNDAETGFQNTVDDLDDIVTDATAQAVIATAQAALATAARIAADADAAATDADAIATAADRVQTGLDRAAVASDKATVAADKATVAADKATVAADKATVAADKATVAADKATASAAATTATTQAGNASTSAGNAATSETNAAASAVSAAASAAQFQGTSATSLLIGTGAKVFTTQAGKLFHGENVRVYSAANSANYMDGLASYSGTTLTVTVASTGGSGTFADWVIKVNGDRGATGATGAAGTIPIAQGAGTVDAITADFTPDITLSNLVLCAVVSTGANTSTTPSFTPDGLTTRTIVKKGGGALVAGDIGAAGFVMLLEYNLANTRWELLNPCKVVSADIVDGTVTASDMAAPASLQNAGTAGGTANAQTLTPTPALGAYAAGDRRTFLPVATNTSGTVTINVSGLGTKNIKKFFGSTVVDLAVGDLFINSPADIIYDGTQYILMSAGNYSQGADIASAATVNLGTATGDYANITGTTGITAVTLPQGIQRTVKFAGILTLTNGASLILPTGANITTAAGDTAVFRGEASGVVRCISYQRASGAALASSGGGTDLQTFVANGTWTKPAGVTASSMVTFRIWDGGASGASRTTTGNANGGAGGAYGEITVPASVLAATETITVAASVAGVTGNTAGNNGNKSSVTINGVTYTISTVTARGGVTAANSGAAASAAGGVAATMCAVAMNGGATGSIDAGNVITAPSNTYQGGAAGGSSSSTAGGTRTGATGLQSTGGTGGANTGGNGTAGTGAGAGGGGAVQGGTSGAGSAGRVEVITYI